MVTRKSESKGFVHGALSAPGGPRAATQLLENRDVATPWWEALAAPIRALLPLAHLGPDINRAILTGSLPPGVTLKRLLAVD